MKIWTEHPARTDVEATIRGYFSLLRAGQIPEAEQLIDHAPVRHVLESLWAGSAGASDDSDSRPSTGGWEQDLSWLRELDLADFTWGDTGSHVQVAVTYRARTIDLALSFWVNPGEAGWVLSGPATLW